MFSDCCLRYEQVPNFGSLPNKLGGFFICTKKINSYNKKVIQYFFHLPLLLFNQVTKNEYLLYPI